MCFPLEIWAIRRLPKIICPRKFIKKNLFLKLKNNLMRLTYGRINPPGRLRVPINRLGRRPFSLIKVRARPLQPNISPFTLKRSIPHDQLVQVQAKRWLHTVGRREVAQLRGSLQPFARGALVTTSHFSKAAITESTEEGKIPIVLVDGYSFASLVRRHRQQLDSLD